METSIRVMMMPKDTNPYGIIFGGIILSYIDQAGAIAAQEYGKNAIKLICKHFSDIKPDEINFVTVAMDKIEFYKPVFVGDVVSFNTEIVKCGTSSVTVKISVIAQKTFGEQFLVTEAHATYVSVKLSTRKAIPIFYNESK